MTLPPAPVPVGPILVPDQSVPERAGTRAIMSTVVRQGDWTLPRLFRVMAFMGQVDLDLTHVRIGAGTSHIEVAAIMGQVNIIVPHNLRVESHGDPILGEFKLKFTVSSAAALDAPLVIVRGSAFMGGVSVKIVDPNAPKWHERWLRRRATREERKERKERRDRGELPGA